MSQGRFPGGTFVNQIDHAISIFGIVPVAIAGLSLVMMAALAFSMSVLAED